MTDTKFTPGPWTVSSKRPLFGYWHVRQDPKDWDGHGYQAICTVPALGKKGTHYADMFHANAQLIAAAPALFEYVESSASAGCATAAALVKSLTTAKGG